MSENVINNQLPIKFERDENGLLKHIQYYFTSEGFIDWRRMVPNKYLYLNPTFKERSKLEKKYNKAYKEIDIVNDKVEDRDLTILLAGFHFLAQARGFSEVLFKPIIDTESFSATVCQIQFLGNFESEGRPIIFSSQAHACLQTTNGFGQKYLSEMCSNRAFCRTVRFFLQVGIIGRDEIFEDLDDSNSNTPSKPLSMLKDLMERKGISFTYIKNKCTQALNKYEGADLWVSVNDIPAKYCLNLIETLQKVKDKD